MDLTTDDQRAWALAPHLVVVGVTESSIEWMNPETGTICRLEPDGGYAVLRRVKDRFRPVVAGQILLHEADQLREEPDAVRSRRAAAHAIVAVDAATAD